MGELAARLVFDAPAGAILDGPRRYLMMRADVFSGAIALAAPEHRPAMLRAFADSVERHGADSVRAYLEALGDDRQGLLSMMPAAAADLGWGVWHFEPVSGACPLRLTVRNSPFAQAFDHAPAGEPVCAPIAGMLGAIGRAWWGRPVRCLETVCRARDRGESCRFEVCPGEPPTP